MENTIAVLVKGIHHITNEERDKYFRSVFSFDKENIIFVEIRFLFLFLRMLGIAQLQIESMNTPTSNESLTIVGSHFCPKRTKLSSSFTEILDFELFFIYFSKDCTWSWTTKRWSNRLWRNTRPTSLALLPLIPGVEKSRWIAGSHQANDIFCSELEVFYQYSSFCMRLETTTEQ